MSEFSWIRGVVLAAASVLLVGIGIGLLATSMGVPAAPAPRPAVLLLPQDGNAVHTGHSAVTVQQPGFEERLKGDPGARPGR
ncbi:MULTISPECIES: hypothetical protein [Streptomyces]|uniref:Uncharacterized protein n=1 Tax=Streptomyces yangpuensis TaxID=1648182 RepID=A0ABY5PRK5_9ACTN|nr:MULTISPECIES: hypothetical protein [Streptomyces]UUY46636.1 hypothetical protein NRK68_05040 [Streptomyces yangpuensis]